MLMDVDNEQPNNMGFPKSNPMLANMAGQILARAYVPKPKEIK